VPSGLDYIPKVAIGCFIFIAASIYLVRAKIIAMWKYIFGSTEEDHPHSQ
jgi:hypothetical protein